MFDLTHMRNVNLCIELGSDHYTELKYCGVPTLMALFAFGVS